MSEHPACIAITPGEPAGVGPDLLVQIAQQPHRARLVAFADPKLLHDRARRLSLPLSISEFSAAPRGVSAPGSLEIVASQLARLPEPGKGSADNASYVLDTLDKAIDYALAGKVDALVTGPVHKYLVNAGLQCARQRQQIFFPATPNTWQQRTGSDHVVMLLSAEKPAHLPTALRVALATTHLPLRDVADAISANCWQKPCACCSADLSSNSGFATRAFWFAA